MKHAVLIILATLLSALLLFWVRSQKTSAGQLKVGGRAVFQIEIVDNVLSQARGLSGRVSLDEDAGMLFVFSRPANRYFWMKDMQFPLDVLWIREGKVIGIERDVPHPGLNNGQTTRFQSPEPADTVLEINAGQAAKKGIKVGDKVSW